MTTPNETKMPERLSIPSHGLDEWVVDENGKQLFRCRDIRGTPNIGLATELARRWNSVASTIEDLQAALADDAKYPQLRLPDMQRQRIEGALRRLRKPTL